MDNNYFSPALSLTGITIPTAFDLGKFPAFDRNGRRNIIKRIIWWFTVTHSQVTNAVIKAPCVPSLVAWMRAKMGPKRNFVDCCGMTLRLVDYLDAPDQHVEATAVATNGGAQAQTFALVYNAKPEPDEFEDEKEWGVPVEEFSSCEVTPAAAAAQLYNTACPLLTALACTMQIVCEPEVKSGDLKAVRCITEEAISHLTEPAVAVMGASIRALVIAKYADAADGAAASDASDVVCNDLDQTQLSPTMLREAMLRERRHTRGSTADPFVTGGALAIVWPARKASIFTMPRFSEDLRFKLTANTTAALRVVKDFVEDRDLGSMHGIAKRLVASGRATSVTKSQVKLADGRLVDAQVFEKTGLANRLRRVVPGI